MTRYEQIHARTAGLRYSGPDKNGRGILIDAAEISPGCFEIMALDEITLETIAERTENDLTAAARAFEEMRERLTKKPAPPAPLSGKYAQLRDDLRAALAAGRDAAARVEDGGACNLDAAALYLPRWNESLVKRAAEEAGTSCFAWSLFGQRRFVFCTRSGGQAYKNERAAEAMTAALKARGYDAFNYCQMD